jgi:S-formylglutathione hydrolase FrmB
MLHYIRLATTVTLQRKRLLCDLSTGGYGSLCKALHNGQKLPFASPKYPVLPLQKFAGNIRLAL